MTNETKEFLRSINRTLREIKIRNNIELKPQFKNVCNVDQYTEEKINN